MAPSDPDPGSGSGSGSGSEADADGRGGQARARLARHVEVLAGEIGERHLGRPAELERAAAYVEREWRAAGLAVAAQPFVVDGATVRNLEVELRGTSRPDEIVVVGAHYDSAPGTPGADDDATGVAAILELARALRATPTARTIRLVAFVNEEAPWFGTDAMGSVRHARRSRARGEDVVAMLSLEMLGYYDRAPGSQQLPELLRGRYPDRGDFLAVVSDPASAALCRAVAERFEAASGFPTEWLAGPTWIEGVALSDHQSYWAEGYRAVMVTDTAFLRNPHYHRASDTPATIDLDALARVVAGLGVAIRGVADAPP